MPFIDDSVPAGLPPRAPAPLEITPPTPPFSKLFDSYLTSSNTVGSITEAAMQPPKGPVDPTYDTFSDVEGYEDHLTSFIGTHNKDDNRAVKLRIDAERRRQELQSTGGWRGNLAQLAAGMLDPVNLIPGGGQIGAITRGGRALEGLIRGGAALGAGTAVQEAILQSTQLTRPLSESVINIGQGAVLGGVLGGAVGALTRPVVRAVGPVAEGVEAGGGMFDRALAAMTGAGFEPRPRIDLLGDSAAAGSAVFDRELAANLPGGVRPPETRRPEVIRLPTGEFHTEVLVNGERTVFTGATSDAIAAAADRARSPEAPPLFGEAPVGEAPRFTTEPDHVVPGQFVAKDITGKVVAEGASAEEALQRAAAAGEAPLPSTTVPEIIQTPAGTFRAELLVPNGVGGGDRMGIEAATPEAVAAAARRAMEPPLPEGAIARDIARQLIAAGHPADGAGKTGQIWQAIYETTAARFNGTRGTAEEIYRAQPPDIVAREAGGLLEDELGQRLRYVNVGGHELPLNPDGTVTLFHATRTPEAADRVVSQKTLRSGGEPSVYLSTAHEGTGYGDHVIAVNVDPKLLRIDDEFPGGRTDFAIDSRSVKVADAARMPSGPLGADPIERALTALDILAPETPPRKSFSSTVEKIALELQTRAQRALRALGVRGGVIAGSNPRTDEILSRAIATEVKAAAQRSGHAMDWYTGKVQEAMRVASAIHPELATDAHARTAYTAALAFTSQGEAVPSNVRLADVAYEHFKRTGRFPTNIEAKQGPSINGNFAKFNRLLDDLGPDGLREFLHREFTVRELEAASGIEIAGENKATRVYGSAIFGPKIGQGFFQNLNGNFTPVTMDLWFMRGWGRLTGQLVSMSEAALVKQRARLEEALTADGRPVPKTGSALERRAQAIVTEHERNFARYRDEYRDGTRTKSELVYAAERYLKGRNGIIEQPGSGSMRNWIRSRVDRARELLGGEGLQVTNADLQALWWYPEKDIYGKMGGEPSEGLNVDYATALRDLAKQKGLSDEDVARAVGTVDRRPGPTAEADVGGGIEAARAGGEAVAREGAQAEPGTPAAPGAAPGELGQAAPGGLLRGKIRPAGDEAGALITLFRGAADASTFLHESWHHWTTQFFRDAAHPQAPADLVADAATLRRAVGTGEGEALTTPQLEQLAQWGEQYLREGKAPSSALAAVFEKFRDWLIKIYRTIDALGEPINDEVRGVYNRMLVAPERQLGGPARGGSVGAAKVLDTDLDQETIAGALGMEKALVRTSPTLRAGTSPSIETRRIAMELADQPLDLKKNVEGLPTATSVESLIKQFQAPLAEAEVGIDDLFVKYRLGRSKRVGTIAWLEARDMFGRPQGAMSYGEFREAISRAMRRGDQSVEPEVAQAASLLRKKVFDPLKDRAIEAGLLPEGVDTQTALSYLMRIYDTTKIVAQRTLPNGGGFEDVITRWLGDEQVKKDAIRIRVTSLLGEHEALSKLAVPRVTRLAAIQTELEDLVKSWEGDTSRQAKAALARRAEAEAERGPDAARLAAADKPVIAAARAMAEANTRQEEIELRDTARQIVDRILGSPVGRLPYDIEVPHPGGAPRTDTAPPRGPLAQRSFMIPDELIEPWLENDSRQIARAYTRTMAPDVLLAERFGRTDMQDQFQRIQAHYAELRAGKSEAEQKKFGAAMNADLRDLGAIRDRLRGTYGLPTEPNGLANRAYHVVRDLNYLRLLGGMTVSALPDMGRLVMVHGLTRTFRDAMVPMLREFAEAGRLAKTGEFRMAAREARLAGTALDMVLDTRAMSIADMLDDYGRWTKYERGVKALTDKFGLVTLMAPWNAAVKQIAGIIGQTRTLQVVEDLVAGKVIRPAERTRLASLGIGQDMAERIDTMFKRYGEKQSNGTWWANSEAWTDRAAIETFRSALNKEIDTTIVTRGQEIPLWMSRGIAGKMLGQFRSFSVASAQRVLLSGLQKRDMATMNGVLMMTALGALVYAIRTASNPKAQPLPDPTTPEGFAQWMRQAVDISGLTGWFFDVHNMVEKATSGGVGLSRLTGGPLQSRYANRGTISAALGPTSGLIEDSAQALGSAVKGTWSAGDSSRVRRMIPFQNLIGMRHLFDAAEHGLNQSIGIRERDRLQ